MTFQIVSLFLVQRFRLSTIRPQGNPVWVRFQSKSSLNSVVSTRSLTKGGPLEPRREIPLRHPSVRVEVTNHETRQSCHGSHLVLTPWSRCSGLRTTGSAGRETSEA